MLIRASHDKCPDVEDFTRDLHHVCLRTDSTEGMKPMHMTQGVLGISHADALI